MYVTYDSTIKYINDAHHVHVYGMRICDCFLASKRLYQTRARKQGMAYFRGVLLGRVIEQKGVKFVYKAWSNNILPRLLSHTLGI